MPETTTVRVHDVIHGSVAVTPDAGDLLYDKLLTNIKQDLETYIDFDNIQYLTSAFLNSAIGQLYATYTGEQLNTYLHVLNLSENDLKIFKEVTLRARSFFSNEGHSTNSFKDIIDE